jgi:hypothetical protein
MKGETFHENVSVLPYLSGGGSYGHIHSVVFRHLLHGDTAFVYTHCGAAVSIFLTYQMHSF